MPGSLMIIYKATNIINGKVYIGQTMYTLDKRREEHFSSSLNSRKGCTVFWRALRKYGTKNFVWEVVATATTSTELNELERQYINKYNCISPKGYNLDSGGNSGKILSDETRRKMSVAQSKENNPMWGKTLTDEHKQKLTHALTGEKNPFYGRTHTEETKRKISETIGDSRKGSNNAFYGRKHSKESKEKQSKIKTGKKLSDYHKQRIAETTIFAKLDKESVLDIKEKLKSGESVIKIAKEYNVSRNAVYYIKWGKTWTHVKDSVDNKNKS